MKCPSFARNFKEVKENRTLMSPVMLLFFFPLFVLKEVREYVIGDAVILLFRLDGFDGFDRLDWLIDPASELFFGRSDEFRG